MLYSIPGVHGGGTVAKEPGKGELGFVIEVAVSPELAEEAQKQIPSELEGIPVIVVVTPPPELLADTSKYRPVPGGCSTAGACLKTAGTLGGWVKRLGGSICCISCEHVFLAWSAASSLHVYQPALFDGGSGSDIVAIKHMGVDPGNHKLDAALGLVSTSDLPDDFNILDIGKMGTSLPPAKDQLVKKRGRTTLLTFGKVDAPIYEETVAGKLYIEQILIKPDAPSTVFVRRGDSGSIVVERNTNGPVGLIFAGYIGGDRDGWGLANNWVLNIKPYFTLDEVA